MLGSPIITFYLKGMRILMFQLSGFYCRPFRPCKTSSLGEGLVGFWVPYGWLSKLGSLFGSLI